MSDVQLEIDVPMAVRSTDWLDACARREAEAWEDLEKACAEEERASELVKIKRNRWAGAYSRYTDAHELQSGASLAAPLGADSLQDVDGRTCGQMVMVAGYTPEPFKARVRGYEECGPDDVRVTRAHTNHEWIVSRRACSPIDGSERRMPEEKL